MNRSFATTLIWTISAVLGLALIPLISDSRLLQDLVIHIAIMGLFATSLNLLIGYLGLVAFGHAMFYGAGAYGFGLLMQTSQFSIPVAIVITLAGSSLLALIVGLVCIRTKEIYFALLTLAIQMMFYSTILTWNSLTGGDQGLMGGFDKPVFFGIDLTDIRQMYWFITVVSAIWFGVLWHITKSPFGYALRMIRDNSQRVEFVGTSVHQYRLAAFVIASSVASIAGMLMCLYVSGAYPNFAFWTLSGEAIFMIMLGGLNTFLGPLMGATILTLLNHFVTTYTNYYGLVLGVIILLYVLGVRKGLLDIIVDASKRTPTLDTNNKSVRQSAP